MRTHWLEVIEREQKSYKVNYVVYREVEIKEKQTPEKNWNQNILISSSETSCPMINTLFKTHTMIIFTVAFSKSILRSILMSLFLRL